MLLFYGIIKHVKVSKPMGSGLAECLLQIETSLSGCCKRLCREHSGFAPLTMSEFVSANEWLLDNLEPFGNSTGDSESHQFIGCSREQGYTCALWHLFHVLAAENSHRWQWGGLHKVRIKTVSDCVCPQHTWTHVHIAAIIRNGVANPI